MSMNLNYNSNNKDKDYNNEIIKKCKIFLFEIS
jgi:hypothetical protein